MGGEGDDRGLDDWMASLTQWTWFWVISRSWWWTGRPGMLQSMGLQRTGHYWATKLNYVAFWDSNPHHRPTSERISCCLETSPPSLLPPQDRCQSLTLLSLSLSFIFCPTCFWKEWAAFLGAWYPLPVFRNCFVEVAQHSNDLLMNLWGRKWSPCPIPPPSWNFPMETMRDFILGGSKITAHGDCTHEI